MRCDMNRMDVDQLTMETIQSNHRYKNRHDALLEKVMETARGIAEQYGLPARALDEVMSSEYMAFYARMAFRTGQRFSIKRVTMVRPPEYEKNSSRSLGRRHKS